MGEVTSYTKEKLDEMFNETIIDGDIDASKNLILTKRNNTTINAGSVEARNWTSFVPRFTSMGVNGTVRYAQYQRIGDSCRIQVLLEGFTPAAVFPGFELPFPPASHYGATPTASGNIGKFFPGVARWAGFTNQAPNVGSINYMYDDLGEADNVNRNWIFAVSPTGSGLGGLLSGGASTRQMYWDTEYQIA